MFKLHYTDNLSAWSFLGFNMEKSRTSDWLHSAQLNKSRFTFCILHFTASYNCDGLTNGGYYPVIEDANCQSFFRCVNNIAGNTTFCEGTSVFNPATSICTDPNAVECFVGKIIHYFDSFCILQYCINTQLNYCIFWKQFTCDIIIFLSAPPAPTIDPNTGR